MLLEVNKHIEKNYNVYLHNAKYYYPSNPIDITNTCLMFVLQKSDEFLKQLLNDTKIADKYIKTKTGLDLYILRTIKINAIHKTSPYQILNQKREFELIENVKLIEEKINTNFNSNSPDILYIIKNKLNLTWFQKELFLAITGIENSQWIGMRAINNETGIKECTIQQNYYKVYKKLKEYILLNYKKEDCF